MKVVINKYEIPALLDNIDISYFEYGTVKRDSESYTYYKCDKLTDLQRDAIGRLFVDCLILGSNSQSAPELSYSMLCFKRGVKTYINSEVIS